MVICGLSSQSARLTIASTTKVPLVHSTLARHLYPEKRQSRALYLGSVSSGTNAWWTQTDYLRTFTVRPSAHSGTCSFDGQKSSKVSKRLKPNSTHVPHDTYPKLKFLRSGIHNGPWRRVLGQDHWARDLCARQLRVFSLFKMLIRMKITFLLTMTPKGQ